MAEERQKVVSASEKADDADGRAEDDAEAAQAAAERRDDVALDLVDRWRTWLTDPTTVDLLGVSDWTGHPLLRVLIAERTALCGEDADSPIALPDLDRAADDTAATARDALAGALARLADADAADRLRVQELTEEQKRLRAARDPEPRQPFWVTAAPDGVPLWRCVDFADQVSDEHRAGIEAALLASGLLTATIDGQGHLTASDGQLLVSPIGDRVTTPLTAVLTPDPAAPLPAETIVAVLEKVALEDRSARTWIDRNGSWGNGPVRGRHTAAAARHIGAAARAAARVQRLAEIDIELGELSAAAKARHDDREQIEGGQRALREHLRSAPRSKALADARTQAAATVSQAIKSAAAARQMRTKADELALAWADNDRQHRRTCAQFGMPTDESALAELHRRADAATTKCQSVTTGIDTLSGWLRRHSSAVQAITAIIERRSAAEFRAAGA